MFEILIAIVPVMAIVISLILYRFLKIEIDKQKIKPVLIAIINAIVSAEQANSIGKAKKEMVIKKIEKSLKEDEKSLLDRVYGGIGNTIEFVFQTIVQPNLVRKITGRK